MSQVPLIPLSDLPFSPLPAPTLKPKANTDLNSVIIDSSVFFLEFYTIGIIYNMYTFFFLTQLCCCIGEGNVTPLQYSCLENPMDGGAWWAAVQGVTKSRTRLTFTFYFPTLEKAMATHSSVLAWRIPGTGEPRGLPSMGLHRVGHD